MAELLPCLTSTPIDLPAGVPNQSESRSRTDGEQSIRPRRKIKNLRVLKTTLNKIDNDSIAYIPFKRSIQPSDAWRTPAPPPCFLTDSRRRLPYRSIWFFRSGRGTTFGEPQWAASAGRSAIPFDWFLPETGLVVNVASARYSTPKPLSVGKRPLLVDRPVTPDAEDIQNGTDPYLMLL